MSKTYSNADKFLTKGFNSYVEPRYVDAPYTEIIGRAQVLDRSQMLQPSMGIERFHVFQINQIADEFGPSGQLVYGSTDERVRFVGSWVNNFGTYGRYASSAIQNDFIEVTFYGTGLNMLVLPTSANQDFRTTIDGGVEGGNPYNASISNVLGARSYEANVVMNVASGLTLGLHTAKIRNASATENIYTYGFEVVNEQTALTVSPGKAYFGPALEYLGAQDSIAYNEGFSGTKGGRVVSYIKDNVIATAKQEVDTTTKYITNTDHSNEEVDFEIHWREFGRSRSDDFSTLAASGIAVFTLADGTTTLVCSACEPYTGETLAPTAAGSYYTITFVGCGLDVMEAGKVVPIVSGLSYGTHVVKFYYDTTSLVYIDGVDTGVTMNAIFNYNITKFVIYRPKKPSIPTGAIELSDYNVMADFTANSTVDVNAIAKGVLRKYCTRELTVIGSWTFGSINPVLYVGGQELATSTSGDKIQFVFFGTGYDVRFRAGSNRSTNIAVTFDGQSDHSGLTTSTYGGATSFTAATGILSQYDASAINGCGFRVSGMSLGLHTVVITLGDSNVAVIECVDIITPIHTNNVEVGSLSLLDTRSLTPSSTALETNLFNGRHYDLNCYSTSLTITSIAKCGGTPFQTLDGRWFIDLKVQFAVSPSAGPGVFTILIPGLLFANYLQPVATYDQQTAEGGGAYALSNSNQIKYYISVSTSSYIAFNGVLELMQKPDFVH